MIGLDERNAVRDADYASEPNAVNHSIAARIHTLRGLRVMLDADLADLYGVTSDPLVQAAARNPSRFPSDFMFRLLQQEVTRLKSQTVILPAMALRYWGRRRKAPYALTEQGVAMLSSVLQLAQKLEELERRVTGHDEAIVSIVRTIRELATPPASEPRRRIGFVTQD